MGTEVTVRAVLEGFENARGQVAGLADSFREVGESAKQANVETTKVSDKLKETKTSIAGMGDAANDAASKFEGLGVAAGAAIAVGIAAALYAAKVAIDKFFEGIDNVRQMGEQFDILSQKTGISVEVLGGFGLAAKTSNLSMEEFGMAIVRLGRNMDLATKETGAQAEAFDRLGISVKNNDGTLKDSDAVLMEIADKFSKTRDSAEKTALAIDLFGRSGASMIPLLNEGAAGLDKLRREAELAGIVLSTETAKAAREFNDNMEVLKAYGQGFWISVASPIVEGMSKIAGAMRDSRSAGDSFFGSLIEGARAAFAALFNLQNGAPEVARTRSALKDVNFKIKSMEDPDAPGTPSNRANTGALNALLRDRAALEAKLPAQLAWAELDKPPERTDALPPRAPKPEKEGRTEREKAGASLESVLSAQRQMAQSLVALGKMTTDEYIEMLDLQLRVTGLNAQQRLNIEVEMQRKKQTVLDTAVKQADALTKQQLQNDKDADAAGVASTVRAYELKLVEGRKAVSNSKSLTEQQKLDQLVALQETLTQEAGYLERYSSEWRNKMLALDRDIAAQRVKVAEETQNQVVQIFGVSTNTTVDLFKSMNKGLTGVFEDILHGHFDLSKSIHGVWTSLTDSIITTVAKIASQAVLEPIFVGMKDVLNPLFKDIGSMLKDVFAGAWTWVKGLFSDSGMFSGVSEASAGIGTILKDVFSSAWTWVKELFSSGDLFSGITSGLSSAFSGIGSMFSGGGGGGGGFFDDILGSIGGLFGGGGGAAEAGGFFETAMEILPFFLPYGDDMVVSSPTMFVAGDNGPERVTVSPIHGSARSPSGGGISIVNNGLMSMDYYQQTKLLRELQRLLG